MNQSDKYNFINQLLDRPNLNAHQEKKIIQLALKEIEKGSFIDKDLEKRVVELESKTYNLYNSSDFESFNNLNNSLSKIDDIYELCIKNKLKLQANNLYKELYLDEIKNELIDDYIRSESFKRENEFKDFSLAIHQQIENITNWLFQNSELREFYLNNEKRPIFESLLDKGNTEDKRHNVSNLVKYNITNKEFEDWDYKTKLRSVLFYFYFGKKLKSYDEFNTIFENLVDIYLIRNLCHRGSTSKKFYNARIEKRILEILSNYSQYYITFSFTLQIFIKKISNNL